MTVSTKTTEIECDSAVRAAQIQHNLPRPDLLVANNVVSRPPTQRGHHRDAVLSKRGVLVAILIIATALAVGVRIGGVQ